MHPAAGPAPPSVVPGPEHGGDQIGVLPAGTHVVDPQDAGAGERAGQPGAGESGSGSAAWV
jgi:hypothetical protein